MADRLLDVKNLKTYFFTDEGVVRAVDGVDLYIDKGETLGVVGESGCGKSVTALSIMKLIPQPPGRIVEGEIIYNGTDLVTLAPNKMRKIRGKEISMIFQEPMTSLNPVFTVGEQIAEAIRLHEGLGRREAMAKTVDMLKLVHIPNAERRVKEYPHQLSGGMRQRIMIAIALQSNPALLVADEPTSALDVTLEAQITDLIQGLRKELNTAVLYITHDLGVVAQLCDQVVVLYAGNIVETGDVFRVFQNPLHPYTQALLRSHPSHQVRARRLTTIPGRVPSLKDLPIGCKFAPRCGLAQAACFAQEPRMARADGRAVLCHAYQPGWQGAPPAAEETPAQTSPGRAEPVEPRVLRPAFGTQDAEGATEVVLVDQMRVHFQDQVGWLGKILGEKQGLVRAVDGVDMAVYRGETLALVGESGSGKTTLGRTILRLQRPTAGGISVEGQNITQRPQAQIRPLRARMQMIFQDPISSLSPRKTVAELLLEPFRIHGVAYDREKKVDELLEMVGLSAEQAGKYPHQLSGGQARRVGIARALALHPALLVADEPTSGLDVSVAAGILNLMRDLRERLSLTYILITHNLNIIGFIADRVAVMYLGKIVEVGQTSTLFNQPGHPYTEALMSAVAIPDPVLRHTRKRIVLEGEIPSSRNPPPGCPFHPRCRYRQARCLSEAPLLAALPDPGHLVACHFSLQPRQPLASAQFVDQVAI